MIPLLLLQHAKTFIESNIDMGNIFMNQYTLNKMDKFSKIHLHSEFYETPFKSLYVSITSEPAYGPIPDIPKHSLIFMWQKSLSTD